MTTATHEQNESFRDRDTHPDATEETTRRVAGATALAATPMNPEHPHYTEWLQHVESQPYQGC